MIRKFFLLGTLILLGWAIFANPTIKVVAAGVAILLFGMFMLEEGFATFVEGPLSKLLKRATNKLYKSLGIGVVVTALLQSSSLITVITISFISAGLIGLKAGIGIIFGSNIGTAATAWLVAIFGLKVDIAALAMPMLVFGILFAFQKSKNVKGIGSILAGLGFFFMGIHFMKEGFETYQDSINLADYAMSGFAGVVVFTLIGILITLILQSSSAAMALVLTALAVGQITYGNSLALAIGANIGTTVTAILGALGANAAGKRLAGAHFIFNLVTGIIALALFVPLGQLVENISDSVGVASDDYTTKLAIFHTIFNIIGVVVMVPLINVLVRFLSKVFVDKPIDEEIDHPVYLNDNALAYPQSAIRALLDESKRLYEKATFEIVAHGLNLHRTDIIGDENLDELVERSKKLLEVDVEKLFTNKVKTIYSKIIKHATLAQSEFTLSPDSVEAFSRIKLANRKIVETMDGVHNLRRNVSKYMLSDNDYIRQEYDHLRYKVARILREIYTARAEGNHDARLAKLNIVKEIAAEDDKLSVGRLDKLITEHRIHSDVAAALTHDNIFAARITEGLIEAGELLYIDVDKYADWTPET